MITIYFILYYMVLRDYTVLQYSVYQLGQFTDKGYKEIMALFIQYKHQICSTLSQYKCIGRFCILIKFYSVLLSKWKLSRAFIIKQIFKKVPL